MTHSSKEGYVYVVTNEAMPNLVKIGRTIASDPSTRFQSLNNSSVPWPFDIQFVGKVDDCKKVEKALHFAFDALRLNPKREFFQIGSENVIAILELLSEDVTDHVAAGKEMADDTATEVQRRPSMRFDDLGLHEGTELIFKRDPSFRVEVSDNPRKVRLVAAPDDYEDLGSEGDSVRMWPLSRDLSVYCGYSHNVGSPTLYWSMGTARKTLPSSC